MFKDNLITPTGKVNCASTVSMSLNEALNVNIKGKKIDLGLIEIFLPGQNA